MSRAPLGPRSARTPRRRVCRPPPTAVVGSAEPTKTSASRARETRERRDSGDGRTRPQRAVGRPVEAGLRVQDGTGSTRTRPSTRNGASAVVWVYTTAHLGHWPGCTNESALTILAAMDPWPYADEEEPSPYRPPTWHCPEGLCECTAAEHQQSAQFAV